MRRAVLAVALAVAACSPAAALAGGWTAATRATALPSTIRPLQFTIRDQHAVTETVAVESARILVVPSDVLFAFDSARLSVAGRREIAAAAGRVAGGPVTVVGHTDARGDAAYNARLGARRAAVVARALGAAVDDEIAIASRSEGERTPIAPNDRAGGRRRNRRVEIVLPG